MDSRTVRLKTEMTQGELAKAIGVSRKAICDFENFKTNSKKVDIRITDYFRNYDFAILESEEVLEKRIMQENIQTSLLVVKEAVDKLAACI